LFNILLDFSTYLLANLDVTLDTRYDSSPVTDNISIIPLLFSINFMNDSLNKSNSGIVFALLSKYWVFSIVLVLFPNSEWKIRSENRFISLERGISYLFLSFKALYLILLLLVVW